MAMVGRARHDKSALQQIDTYKHLNSKAETNQVERSAITFEDGAIELCDALWGKPT
jgi:hypothetical protein